MECSKSIERSRAEESREKREKESPDHTVLLPPHGAGFLRKTTRACAFGAVALVASFFINSCIVASDGAACGGDRIDLGNVLCETACIRCAWNNDRTCNLSEHASSVRPHSHVTVLRRRASPLRRHSPHCLYVSKWWGSTSVLHPRQYCKRLITDIVLGRC